MTSNADVSEVRSAFRSLSKELHPDTTSIPYEEASRKFQAVCEAYELLSDPSSRADYDLSISNQSGERQSPFNYRVTEPHSLENRKSIGFRRALSGGELLSLSLLVIALVISMLLGIGFALLQGKELFVAPSWMMTLIHLL